MSKNKRVIKSKEEVITQLRKDQDFVKKMKFVKDQLFPALCNSSKSIDDATMFLSSINNILMEKFLGYMKEKKFAELKLVDILSPVDPKYEETKKLLALFDDMSVFDAKELLEGMRSEINLFVQKENELRPLSDLKTTWIDELIPTK